MRTAVALLLTVATAGLLVVVPVAIRTAEPPAKEAQSSASQEQDKNSDKDSTSDYLDLDKIASEALPAGNAAALAYTEARESGNPIAIKAATEELIAARTALSARYAGKPAAGLGTIKSFAQGAKFPNKVYAKGPVPQALHVHIESPSCLILAIADVTPELRKLRVGQKIHVQGMVWEVSTTALQNPGSGTDGSKATVSLKECRFKTP